MRFGDTSYIMKTSKTHLKNSNLEDFLDESAILIYSVGGGNDRQALTIAPFRYSGYITFLVIYL